MLKLIGEFLTIFIAIIIACVTLRSVLWRGLQDSPFEVGGIWNILFSVMIVPLNIIFWLLSTGIAGCEKWLTFGDVYQMMAELMRYGRIELALQSTYDTPYIGWFFESLSNGTLWLYHKLILIISFPIYAGYYFLSEVFTNPIIQGMFLLSIMLGFMLRRRWTLGMWSFIGGFFKFFFGGLFNKVFLKELIIIIFIVVIGQMIRTFLICT